MKDLIIISGAPGSGKSSVSRLLKEKLDSVHVAFGHLRQFHLDKEWIKKHEDEEKITFENCIFIINNYIKHGYKNIIVDDLQDFRVPELHNMFKNSIVFTLCPSDEEIEKRIKLRNSGWKDFKRAVEWNQSFRASPILKDEFRVDNTDSTPEKTTEKILEILQNKI